MNDLIELNTLYRKHLHGVRQLSLVDWCELADSLSVSHNDREHAAKKLAIREINGK